MLASVLLLVSFAAAEVPQSSVSQLRSLVGTIRRVEPYVERQDLRRLRLLQRTADNVLKAISENGAANIVTLQSFQELIIAYRFSKDLFRVIRTDRTGEKLDYLGSLVSNIAKNSGLDRSPYTTVTESVFSQIHQLLGELSRFPLPVSAQTSIASLNAPLGRLLAIAQEGDHLETFCNAASVSRKLRALDPVFNSVSSSDEAFYVVIDIQGLNDFYEEFSRISDVKGACAQ